MLTFDDNSTIRNAIIKRLDREPGVKIADLKMIDHSKPPTGLEFTSIEAMIAAHKAFVPHIQVGLWLFLEDTIGKDGEGMVDLRSFFDLPAQFSITHLHNEIDEIAESCKKARTASSATRLLHVPGLEHKRKEVVGTGLRGRWGA